jgi:hypothetical protein
LSWFSLICPLIGAINQTMLASITSIPVEGTVGNNANIRGAINASKNYFTQLSPVLQGFIENGAAVTDFVGKITDVGIIDVSTVTNVVNTPKNVTYNISSLMESLKLTGDTFTKKLKSKYDILSKVFCLLMYNFILFTSSVDNTIIKSDIMELVSPPVGNQVAVGGGKKAKRVNDPVKALLEFNNKTLQDILNPAKSKTKSARKPKKAAAATPAKKKK